MFPNPSVSYFRSVPSNLQFCTGTFMSFASFKAQDHRIPFQTQTQGESDPAGISRNSLEITSRLQFRFLHYLGSSCLLIGRGSAAKRRNFLTNLKWEHQSRPHSISSMEFNHNIPNNSSWAGGGRPGTIKEPECQDFLFLIAKFCSTSPCERHQAKGGIVTLPQWFLTSSIWHINFLTYFSGLRVKADLWSIWGRT